MPCPCRAVLAVVAALMVVASPGVGRAGELKLIGVNALKEPLVELTSAFEKSSGHKTTLAWGGTEAITKRLNEGEAADVVIIAAPNIDKLIAEGKLATASRADVARVGVGMAVRAGQPKPDISSAEAVKQAVLAAKSIAYSTGPSGFYVAELFKKMGIADHIAAKLRQPPSGAQISDLLARGEADLGFQQISELLHRSGIDYVGPLPPDIQNMTIYAAGLGRAAAPEAKALVEFLTGPAAAPILRKTGLEPPG